MTIIGLGSYYVGKFHRQPRVMMSRNAWMFGVTGFIGQVIYSRYLWVKILMKTRYSGFMLAFERSSHRLMGWKDNAKEVSKD